MTNDGKLFADELTNWLIYEAGFNQSKFQMAIYYNYAPDGSRLVVLYYVDDCVYWYKYDEPGKGFVDTLGKRLHLKFLGYANCFMSIRISQMKDHYISVDKARYATSIVAKYLDTGKIKANQKFHKIISPHDMIFTKHMLLSGMNKWKYCLYNTTLTTELVWNHRFIFCLQEWIYVFHYKIWQSFHQILVK